VLNWLCNLIIDNYIEVIRISITYKTFSRGTKRVFNITDFLHVPLFCFEINKIFFKYEVVSSNVTKAYTFSLDVHGVWRGGYLHV
jgi:hypothetical protein